VELIVCNCASIYVNWFLTHVAEHCGEWSVGPSTLWERSLCQVWCLEEALDLSASFTRRGWLRSVFYMYSTILHSIVPYFM